MAALRDRMRDSNEFLCGIEVVSTRGTMGDEKALKTRKLVNQLMESDRVDWLSITDNAGGHPQLKPVALGKPILYAGKQVVIHLTCKDFNRNGIESEAWELASEGFDNILALSGDYPIDGFQGSAKPVFDIDSIGLLELLTEMNKGLAIKMPSKKGGEQRLHDTHFWIGVAASNIKLRENEIMPQYFKLKKKLECGAHFVINQIGYDSRKHHEMKTYLDRVIQRPDVPLFGNVYVLSGFVAKFFNSGKIPGVVVSDGLKEECLKHVDSPDKGRSWFQEFAAKQVAIYRMMGYRGVYFGGVHSAKHVANILEKADGFTDDDARTFAKEIQFNRPGEFYFYAEDKETGLADPERINPEYEASLKKPPKSKHVTMNYKMAKKVHDWFFTPGKGLFPSNSKKYAKCKNQEQGPGFYRAIERHAKASLFDCRDCGDCSLPDIAFLCPESQCAKNQRNGPCGGTHEGFCEVYDLDCIWGRAYDRLKHDRRSEELLDHVPVVQDQGLRGTSSWANIYLKKDHRSKKLARSE